MRSHIQGVACRKSFHIGVLCFGILIACPAYAQVHQTAAYLSEKLAAEAAQAALDACSAQGNRVSVFVVNTAGETLVSLKGDYSTVHTKDSAYKKAYTMMTLGPIWKEKNGAGLVEHAKTNPAAPAITAILGLLVVPGTVAVEMKGEIVAAIGVGGADAGPKDEACAQKGLDKIKAQLGN